MNASSIPKSKLFAQHDCGTSLPELESSHQEVLKRVNECRDRIEDFQNEIRKVSDSVAELRSQRQALVAKAKYRDQIVKQLERSQKELASMNDVVLLPESELRSKCDRDISKKFVKQASLLVRIEVCT